MIYRILRWMAGIALHWFYGEIRIRGEDRVPIGVPLLLAVNHQNALIDALLAGWTIPRRVTLTAKATLADNPLNAWLFRTLGIVPLRRSSDERVRVKESVSSDVPVTTERNEDAFRQLIDVLRRNGTVLIFPEGKSHSEPGLAPLKSGLARIAFRARKEGDVMGIHILPIGLAFEDKGRPGSLVVAQIGRPVPLDEWEASSQDGGSSIGALTETVADRLRMAITEGASRLTEPPSNIDPGSIARLFAAWGKLNFKIPVDLARKHAERGARSPDQPAMFTIINGVKLILAFSITQAVLIGFLLSWWIALLYFASLPVAAYWSAFIDHPAEARSRARFES
jgi:1-acyl-sn-glycerol-3-phosphate acyltransferase